MEIEDEQEENEDEMEIDDLILDAEEKKNRLKQKDAFERELDKIVAEYAPDIKNFHIFDQNMMARADNTANSVNEKDHDLKVMVAHLAKIKERAIDTGSNTGEMWKLIEGLDSLLRRKTAMNDNLMFSRRIIERDKEVIKSILQKVKDNDKNLDVIMEVQKVYEKNMDKQDVRHEKLVEGLIVRHEEQTNALQKRIRELEIQMNRRNDIISDEEEIKDNKQKIKEAYQKNNTIEDIVKITGLSRTTVVYWIKRIKEEDIKVSGQDTNTILTTNQGVINK